jgi:hypothetical protein
MQDGGDLYHKQLFCDSPNSSDLGLVSDSGA